MLRFEELRENLEVVIAEAVVESCLNPTGTRMEIEVNMETGECFCYNMQQNTWNRDSEGIWRSGRDTLRCGQLEFDGFVDGDGDGLFYESVEDMEAGEDGLTEEEVIRTYYADELYDNVADDIIREVEIAFNDYQNRIDEE